MSQKLFAPAIPVQGKRIEAMNFCKAGDHRFGIASNTDGGGVSYKFEAAGNKEIREERKRDKQQIGQRFPLRRRRKNKIRKKQGKVNHHQGKHQKEVTCVTKLR